MASSASEDRAFSIAGKVLKPDRYQLTDNNEITLLNEINDVRRI